MTSTQLIMPLGVKLTLEKLAASFTDEWTLFGKIENLGQGIFRLVEVAVPKQKNSAGSTVVDDTNLAKFVQELIDRGENPAGWRCWIHSHNTMGAFWSGTDTAQMESFDMGEGGPPFMVHLVVSSNDEKPMRAAISLYHPVKITLDPIKIVIEYPTTDVEKEIKILEKLITERTEKVVYSSYWDKKTYSYQQTTIGDELDADPTEIWNKTGSVIEFSSRVKPLKRGEDLIFNMDYTYLKGDIVLLYYTRRVDTCLDWQTVDTLGGISKFYFEFLEKGTLNGDKVLAASITDRKIPSKRQRKRDRKKNHGVVATTPAQ